MIKNLILDYKIGNTARKKASGGRTTTTYQQAQRIGIVFTNDDEKKLNLVNEFASTLRLDGKEVAMLPFASLKKDRMSPALEFGEISKKDLTVSCKWKKDDIYHFINSSFDYLLHLDLERNKYIDYIFAESNAKCRIGACHDNDQHHYELIVSLQDQKKGLKEYLGELKKYLKIIGSNEH